MPDDREQQRAAEAGALDREILAFIADGRGDFDGLALRLFAHQFAFNRVYRGYCLRRGRTPDTVRHWRDVPAVPTAAFKAAEIAAFPPARAVRTFHTSGTTEGTPGRHFFETTRLYDAALRAHFAAMMLPDGARPIMLSLTPPPAEAPHGSLVHMIAELMAEFDPTFAPDAAADRFFVRGGAVRTDGFRSAVRRAAGAGRPLCLFGTAFAWVHLLDSAPVPVALPPGSRILETGGFKGRSREVGRAELYDRLSQVFAVPADHIIAEYGMTELSSQYYDDVFADRPAGPAASAGFGPTDPRIKRPPPWMRPVVVDPATLEELPVGAVGLLRHVDLANRGSVIAVQTEDLGRIAGGGIELLGRAADAEPRGCSLALEQLLLGDRGENP
jgi:hypothetical protein